MKKFHLTITNNITGEIEKELDTDAIIGAMNTDESTCGVCLADCNLIDLAATCAGALRSVDRAMEDLPKPLRKAVEEARKLKGKH